MPIRKTNVKYYQTKTGLLNKIYNKMQSRYSVEFTWIWFLEFSNCKRFERLFKEWKKSGYLTVKVPTVDRMNSKKPYSKENIQWMTWEENRYKQRMEIKHARGRLLRVLCGEVVSVYNSIDAAANDTGMSKNSISLNLNGWSKHDRKGYYWCYEKDFDSINIKQLNLFTNAKS